MQKLEGKSVLVIGLGLSGRSAVRFLLNRGAHVSGIDGNQELLKSNPEIAILREAGLKTIQEPIQLQQFDLIVVSPGVPQTHPLYVEARNLGIEVIGEIELACRFLKGTFLGITGTNGKTTVTLLVTHVLNHSGKSARALGNLGVALTSETATEQAEQISVVELSSFQLETLHSRVIDAAVLLNVTPDHLDRYSGMDHYALAKLHIADCLKPGGEFYVEDKCWQEFGHLFNPVIPITAKTYGYREQCDLSTDLQHLISNKKIASMLPSSFRGKVSHDLENLMAAYALCQHVGVTPEQFMEAVKTFKKPAHRIEFVREHKGVSYYDDSKGTNIDAVVRAVDTIQGNIVLIAGGVDKGSAYTPWIAAFADRVKCVCAIGQAAPKIQQDLSQAMPVALCKGLEEAVNYAAQLAQPGDTVLLSPGCSSFDMFRDYSHRGEEFQRIVKQL